MQKQVSKQSLAIIALSILLAICMALTATYAAFAATNKTVTGTITFTAPQLTITLYTAGNQAVTSQGTLATDGYNIAMDGDNIIFTLDTKAFEAKTVSETDQVNVRTEVVTALQAINYSIQSTMDGMDWSYTIATSIGSKLSDLISNGSAVATHPVTSAWTTAKTGTLADVLTFSALTGEDIVSIETDNEHPENNQVVITFSAAY